MGGYDSGMLFLCFVLYDYMMAKETLQRCMHVLIVWFIRSLGKWYANEIHIKVGCAT